MKKHASKPPSGAVRWSACPGSIPLEMTLPEGQRNVSSVFAQEGTAAHDLLERCLRENKSPHTYMGRLIEVVETEHGSGTSMLRKGARMPKDPQGTIFEVDEDMAQAVDECVEYVEGRVDDTGRPRDEALRTERRVHALPERDDCYGTADVTIDDWPDVLETVDYKHGKGVVVEIEGNKQLGLYMLATALEDGFRHDLYRMTICQPRAPHKDGSIRSETMDASELRQFHKNMLNAANRVDEADSSLRTNTLSPEKWQSMYLKSGDHCRFCDAIAICPQKRDDAADVARMDFDDEPGAIPVPVEPEEIGRLLAHVPMLDAWCRALQAHGQRWLEAGNELPGYKLVRKKSNRTWVDMKEKKLISKMYKIFSVHNDQMYTDPKLVTGPQAEKLVAKDLRGKFNEEMLHKPEGGLTMAPDDDDRVAMTADPGEDFKGEKL